MAPSHMDMNHEGLEPFPEEDKKFVPRLPSYVEDEKTNLQLDLIAETRLD